MNAILNEALRERKLATLLEIEGYDTVEALVERCSQIPSPLPSA